MPSVADVLEGYVESREIAGAVTVVVTDDGVADQLATAGFADIEAERPMAQDTLFRIASMTKPITGAAILMLQDEGKLHVSDLVSKHIPAFAELKAPSGQPANLTIAQMMTHTSGLGEGPNNAPSELPGVTTLAHLVPHWLDSPMNYQPGSKWQYTQSGINCAGRIVETLAGQDFDEFLEQRLFRPLGMSSTTFYPTAEQQSRLASTYSVATPGELNLEQRDMPTKAEKPPLGNGGLFSTARDYAAFLKMLLRGGAAPDGRQLLSAEAMSYLASPQTPDDMNCGFCE